MMCELAVSISHLCDSTGTAPSARVDTPTAGKGFKADSVESAKGSLSEAFQTRISFTHSKSGMPPSKYPRSWSH